MYVGAGIGQQNPSGHLPALSSASGLSLNTVRPSQGWAALPHRLAPSLAHAWRDKEHTESCPSYSVSRQCHQQCSGAPEPLELWVWPRAQLGWLGQGDGPQGIPGPGLLMAGTDRHGTDGHSAAGRTCSLVMPGSMGERSGLPHTGVCAGGVGREPGRRQRGLQRGEWQLLGPVTAARSGGSESPRLGPMAELCCLNLSPRCGRSGAVPFPQPPPVAGHGWLWQCTL